MSGEGGAEQIFAKYDYEAQEPQELSINKNERLTLIDDSKNWWKVSNAAGRVGFVPSNFVRREGFMDKVKGSLSAQRRAKPQPQHPTTNAFGGQDENGQSSAGQASSNGNGHAASPNNNSGPRPIAVAKFAYAPQRDDELALSKGMTLRILDKSADGWWKGEFDGAVGWFPSNYVAQKEDGADAVGLGVSVVGGERGGSGEKRLPLAPGEEVLETVLCLFSFTAQSEEELSFEKGERLWIVEHPAHDPEWWRARNAQGQSGLVPTNYIQVVAAEPSPAPSQTSSGGGSGMPLATHNNGASKLTPSGAKARAGGRFAGERWYFGRLSREESDALLNDYGSDGLFIVRDSESNPGDLSISLKAVARNKHFWVRVADDGFRIGNRHFPDMATLIHHYTNHPIYTNDKTGERLFIRGCLNAHP